MAADSSHSGTSTTNKYLPARPECFLPLTRLPMEWGGSSMTTTQIQKFKSDLGNKFSLRNVFTVTCLGPLIQMLKLLLSVSIVSLEAPAWQGQGAVLVPVTSGLCQIKDSFMGGYSCLMTGVLRQTPYSW